MTIYCNENVPLLTTEFIFSAVMFLCPSGTTPNLAWNGIFGSPPQENQSKKHLKAILA